MPKKIIQLNIFLASPNDVLEERSAVDEIVEELNIMLMPEKNIVLNVKMGKGCFS